jgi:beta-lactamase regulating signal transducer with metallopeptidase domain
MTAYIIKSSLSLVLLFGLYWFLLRKEKFFIFNRFFLIFSVIFSLTLPFITIPVYTHVPTSAKNVETSENIVPQMAPLQNRIINEIQNSDYSVVAQPQDINISSFLFILYIAGALIFLLRFQKNIYDIFRRIRLSEKISFDDHRLILTREETNPYCFFNNIFIYKDDYLNLGSDDHLLNHELAHVRQLHSADIVFIELIKIFFWFNPVFLLYERAIRINHEYLADNYVINDNSDIKGYAERILSFIVGKNTFPLTSGSNQSFVKKRLLMMTKSGSGSFNYGLRITVTVCIVMVFFLLMSFKETYKIVSENYPSVPEDVSQQNVVSGIVLGEDGKPLKEATVISMDTTREPLFITTGSDGYFALYNLQIHDSLKVICMGYKDQILKANLVSEMVVKMIRDPKVWLPDGQYVYFRNSDFTPANALLVVNGEILDYNMNLKLNTRDIKSIKILKDKEATDKYGERGKDGVVEIFLHGSKTNSPVESTAFTENTASDTSKFNTLLSINHGGNKSELIDIPVSKLQLLGMSIYHNSNNPDKKGLRYIGIITRDYYTVRGKVVRENGSPLPGVAISVSDEPVRAVSDKEGRFVIDDVKENALLMLSLKGYKPYYQHTSFVPFTTELIIKLEKDKE